MSSIQDIRAAAAAKAAAHQQANAEQADDTAPVTRTFVHQVAGANVIMPEGKKLVFFGRSNTAARDNNGNWGHYTTHIPAEIAELETIARMPGSQVTELVTDVATHTERLVKKNPDPSLAQAAIDAARNSENAASPAASAVAANLGKIIASTGASGQQ